MTQRQYGKRRAKDRARHAWVGSFKLKHGQRHHVYVAFSSRWFYMGSFTADRRVRDPRLEWAA